MKFAATALIFTTAIVGTFAVDATCPTCPNSLDALVGLVNQLQQSLAPLLNVLPLNLGSVINQVLDLVKNLLSNLGNGLTGDLQNVLQQIGTTVQTLLGGGTVSVNVPQTSVPGICLPSVETPQIYF
ncbi:unnamed protein product [Phyllotreta striolata]|uniref:Uncharacterized protein n=1 Tax=Phyllotreta striolata TaxID=444603 RepID=A0A9N9XLW8_PHYSR|nr:unnamed protein product [Phyllotreta striolata]